ncbi:TetR/AcrR family transcriptional regulator [Cupriavidus basilensis]|uniref:TetR/AcrR family transcriptional regulator n=1 Tax=Cupriavidus basilensis TaxID=68895 RepID=UPI000696FBAE|nr:TetR/AcrR family transcriptional regulator [Cupriavidus basilensis]
MEFDRDQVLMRAVDAFWHYGYESLSTNILAEEMGVSKSSLYNTAGSKRDLLIESVIAYTDTRVAAIRQTAGSDHPLKELRALLLNIAQDNDGGRGCLLVNMSSELGLHDGGVQQLVRSGFQSILDSFELLVISGQLSGAFKSEIEPAESALAIVTTIAGLRVLAKAGFSASQLAPAIENLTAGLAAHCQHDTSA